MALLGIYMVACVLLVAAGVAKACRPGETARALIRLTRLRSPDVRSWSHYVRLLAVLEAAVGIAALIAPQPVPAALVASSYLFFTAWVLSARARGAAMATCGCFGGVDTPPTVAHAVVTLVLATGAASVALAAPKGNITRLLYGQVAHGVPLVLAVAVAALLAYAVMSPLARLGALRSATPGGSPS